MKNVFIDGSAGTTGLKIRERLSAREGLNLVSLPDDLRKDLAARKELINSSDIVFLCLPDAAAIEAVALVENDSTVIIDTSTAHRVMSDWTYGLPELEGQRDKLRSAKRIANPGCHASGFIALMAPLVNNGIVASDAAVTAFSLTGYSGGGKKMIADYESASTFLHRGGRQYALGQQHKHLPEMAKYAGLSKLPVFSPIVVPHYSGMEVTIPLFGEQVKGGLAAARNCLKDVYADNGLIRYVEDPSEDGIISSAALSGKDYMEVSVFGNEERMILVARFDNLGKGASGAAIQNMNIVLGAPESTGLII